MPAPLPPLPPLAAVRVFEAAARHENYSRAAEELGLTQAGVSYQIKLLEERLGAQLFARAGRGIALTPLGRRIAPRVGEAFAMLGEAFSVVQAENEAVLTITVPRTFATNWLASRLGAFNLMRPNLAVRLHVADELVDLSTGEIDVAIRCVAQPGPGLVGHLLVADVVRPLASPDFLTRHPLSEPADLLGVRRLSPADEWWEMWFASLSKDYAGARDPGLRFDSQVLDAQAAMAGHGVAILSEAMFAGEVAAGRLVAPFAHAATDPRPYWLVYPEQKRRLTKVRAFRDWILKEFETRG